jgi:U3 small nucleolar RNA-associated protein 4
MCRDGTIVSGDSLGHTQFWDGTQGVLTQSFSVHSGDVLSLAWDWDGHAVYSAGVDPRMAHFVRTPTGSWKLAETRQCHTHDVRGMVYVPAFKNKKGAVVASAGVDTKVCLVGVRPAIHDFGKQGQQQQQQQAQGKVGELKVWPSRSVVSFASSSRKLVAHLGGTLQLWRLGQGP